MPVSAPKPAPVIPSNVLEQFDLKGRVAIVTGAAANIGLAVAQGYAEAGADVAIWFNGNLEAQTRAEEISAKHGVRCVAYKCNVKNYDDIKATVGSVQRDFGKIDIFVANAGVIQDPELVTDGNPALWEDIIAVNYTSVVSCAAVIGPVFRSQGHGKFIATASAAGHNAVRGCYSSLYNSLKAGVRTFCSSLAYEWADFAHVNSVSPGYFGDGMGATDKELNHAYSQTVLGRFGGYHELKAAYLFLASDASSFVTGSDIVVDGGYSI